MGSVDSLQKTGDGAQPSQIEWVNFTAKLVHVIILSIKLLTKKEEKKKEWVLVGEVIKGAIAASKIV